jgi:hypothetical protein
LFAEPSCPKGSSQPSRSRANDSYIANQLAWRRHGVRISIIGSHTMRQVRVCFTPFTVARHSKQIPIPHSGAKFSAFGSGRARNKATATEVPAGTRVSIPLRRIGMLSAVRKRFPPGWQVTLAADR